MVRTNLETKYYYYKHYSSSHSMGYRDQENTLLLCKTSYIIKIKNLQNRQKQDSRSSSMSTITEYWKDESLDLAKFIEILSTYWYNLRVLLTFIMLVKSKSPYSVSWINFQCLFQLIWWWLWKVKVHTENYHGNFSKIKELN